MASPSEIQELSLLDDIELIGEEYENQFGIAPVNISNWDPSSAIVGSDMIAENTSSIGNGVDYLFSYNQPNNTELRNALGYKSEEWRSLTSHSGSSAIVMVCNWLRTKGCLSVLIVGPVYFTVPHCLNALGIKFIVVHCKRTAAGYDLPHNLDERKYDAVWITNPIYCASVYLDNSKFKGLVTGFTKRGVYVVVDECLAAVGKTFGDTIDPSPFVCTIVAPHKAVCINAIKFALALFHESELIHFEHWSDVWLGCLPHSSVRAINHVLSDEYHSYAINFNDTVESQSKIFVSTLNQFNHLEIDSAADGYFRTVYCPELEASCGNDTVFLRHLIFDTGATLIPGSRNMMDPSVGFCFRVNLAALDQESLGGLQRVCQKLSFI